MVYCKWSIQSSLSHHKNISNRNWKQKLIFESVEYNFKKSLKNFQENEMNKWNFFPQDMVNKYKVKKKTMEEGVLFYYTIALLRILETMHACDVIHGDIKPDNFLVLDR